MLYNFIIFTPYFGRPFRSYWSNNYLENSKYNMSKIIIFSLVIKLTSRSCRFAVKPSSVEITLSLHLRFPCSVQSTHCPQPRSPLLLPAPRPHTFSLLCYLRNLPGQPAPANRPSPAACTSSLLPQPAPTPCSTVLATLQDAPANCPSNAARTCSHTLHRHAVAPIPHLALLFSFSIITNEAMIHISDSKDK